MKLLRIEIQTLPGIQPGFVLDDFDPGLNLVLAPNAAGKSSLIRALRLLLREPASDDPATLALAAEFASGAGRWRVERTGREIRWQLEGQPATPPPLPDPDQQHCYWLVLEDLLAAEHGPDDHLVRALRLALGGGYDLDALSELDFVRLGPQHGQREARQLRTASRERKAVEAEYRKLQEQGTTLPALERRIETAQAARARIQKLEQALALINARRRRRGVEALLRDYPDGMGCLTGDEPQRLAGLERKRQQATAALQASRVRREEAQHRRHAAGLESGLPPTAELESARQWLQQLIEANGEQTRQRDLLSAAEAERDRLRHELDPDDRGAADAPRVRIGPVDVSRGETLARRLQELIRDREAIARSLADGDDPDAARQVLPRHRQARDALDEWLAACVGARRQRAALLLATLAVVATLALAVSAQAWPQVAAMTLGLAALLWAWLERSPRGARQRFTASGLTQPATWQVDAVRERRDALDAEIANLEVIAAGAGERARAIAESERLDRELAAARDAQAELARELGFDPALTAAGFDRFLRLASAWDKADEDCAAHRARLDRLEARHAEIATILEAWLRKWGVVLPTANAASIAGHRAALQDLEQRVEEARSAQRMLDEEARERHRIARELEELRDEADAVFDRCGLRRGDRTELERRCSLLGAWRDLREQMIAVRRDEEVATAALDGDTSLLALTEANDETGLEHELADCRQQAEALEALRKQFDVLDDRLRRAGEDLALEQAAAVEDSAREALQTRHEQACFATTARVLLDSVARDYRSEHEPEVLRDARARFRRFTHHEFDLELDPRGGFMARDLRQHALRSLAELSSGTRMQLLLAVRLAWARRIEQRSEPLPLFLDEALTTSDEARFARIAENLVSLVSDEDRQLFYLGARSQELGLWTHCIGRRPHLIDLPALRVSGPVIEAAEWRLPDTDAVPAPETDAPESYAAALGVPAVDPRLPPGEIHVFHLLRDDLPLLYRLLSAYRISRLGPLQALLESDLARNVIGDADLRQRLSRRCIAAARWTDAWRIGRGRPVDRGDLETSAIVSATFIDRVAARARELDGDAAALIADLRSGSVRRFRSDTIDALENWLTDHGHIDPRPPLTANERRLRVIAADPAGENEAAMVADWLETAAALHEAGEGVDHQEVVPAAATPAAEDDEHTEERQT